MIKITGIRCGNIFSKLVIRYWYIFRYLNICEKLINEPSNFLATSWQLLTERFAISLECKRALLGLSRAIYQLFNKFQSFDSYISSIVSSLRRQRQLETQ